MLMQDVQNYLDSMIMVISQPKIHCDDSGGDVDIDRQAEEYADELDIASMDEYPWYDEYNQDALRLDEVGRYRDALEV